MGYLKASEKILLEDTIFFRPAILQNLFSKRKKKASVQSQTFSTVNLQTKNHIWSKSLKTVVLNLITAEKAICRFYTCRFDNPVPNKKLV